MNRKKILILHYKIIEYPSCKGSTKIIIPKGPHTHTKKIRSYVLRVLCKHLLNSPDHY